MIVILSSESHETTTEKVIDWIDSLGGDCLRINGEDLISDAPYVFRFDGDGTDAVFHVGGSEVNNRAVNVVWFRRWRRFHDFPTPGLQDLYLRHTVDRYLGREMYALTEGIFRLFEHAKWLSSPAEARLSKLHMLQLAAEVGLVVPATVVTNCKSYLRAFKDEHGNVITKCIGDVDVFRYSGRSWGMYTTELTQANIDAAPEVFFPTLVQERLEKSYEVRSFFLDGEFFSMAIFSQNDIQTKTDFRKYNLVRPNRCVPYCLPSDTVSALRRFVEAAELSTGSIDLVRTPDGRHIFLEVNPGGQFGMISRPCNYFLEKKVAEYLMRRDCCDYSKSSRRPQPVASITPTVTQGAALGTQPAKITQPAPGETKLESSEAEKSEIRTLFAAPAAGPERYPLNLHLMDMASHRGAARFGESRFHRASAYACLNFYKPISRPVNFGIPTKKTVDDRAGNDK